MSSSMSCLMMMSRLRGLHRLASYRAHHYVQLVIVSFFIRKCLSVFGVGKHICLVVSTGVNRNPQDFMQALCMTKRGGRRHLQRHLPGSSSAPLPGPALPHGPCQRWPPGAHWGGQQWQSSAACGPATHTQLRPAAAKAAAKTPPPHLLPNTYLLASGACLGIANMSFM